MSGGPAPDIVRATYRLQFHRGFTFREAEALVPYLARLGISHLYASPVMEARPGSTHGYDIVDHNRFNPEIGSEAEFRSLVAALRVYGMGLILDFVPNHMGVGGRDNVWWLDVLEWGEESPYAAYFDINWDATRTDLKGKVLLPVLGDQYGVVLESGDIALRFDPAEGSFSAWYYEHRFPISPRNYGQILEQGGPSLAPLVQAAARLRNLAAEPAREQAALLKGRLTAHAPAVEAAAAAFAGEPGKPASFRRLHRLLAQQSYRIAYWRVATEEINYRRFFNINDLAGLRMESPQLFEVVHRLVFDLIERGDVQGLRIDHIDGLFDPAGYCAALQIPVDRPLYVLVEKILARYENLPDWPIAGTTGYDFANQVLALFVDPSGETAMTRLYRRLAGRTEDFDTVLYACKKRIMRLDLASEMNVLAGRFHRLSVSEWHTRDFTLNAMLAALEEIVAAFPVYRTYVSERGCSDEDRHYIDWALALARKRWRTDDTTIFDFLHGVLTASPPGHSRPDDVLRTAMQFQQITGPVMAKAYEDTAYYRYVRLLALNEVGGDPRRFGISVAAFHRLMQDRGRRWPAAMISTATHDTKRGEDARIRLALLSELPMVWGRRVMHWTRLNRRHRGEVDGDTVPDRNTEYLFYQTLVGVWPTTLDGVENTAIAALAERVSAYMIKAVREGKEFSGWSNPRTAYEATLQRFIASVLDPARPNPFLTDFGDFVATLARPAAIASLAQVTLKLTVPGVPDIYQGTELWDFSMVDPDNRRPVDWRLRTTMIKVASDDTGKADWRDGHEKLRITRRLLDLRRERPLLFAAGDHQPLDPGGSRAEHVCAFVRRHQGEALAVVVPRLTYRLLAGRRAPEWGDTAITLPERFAWREVFSRRAFPGGTSVGLADLLSGFPVAVLLGESGGEGG